MRLRPLTRLVCGDDRPKQYVPLLGGHTLLGQTLDRVRLGIPTARTAVVTVQGHAAYVAAECSGPRAPHVLVQPDNRGTAAGVLFPAHWIFWRDPDATVAGGAPVRYDVIVVGAGPGVATATYESALRGLMAALVEQKSVPLYKPCLSLSSRRDRVAFK